MNFNATHVTVLIIALLASVVALTITHHIPERVVADVSIALGGFVVGLARQPPLWLRRLLGLPVPEPDDVRNTLPRYP